MISVVDLKIVMLAAMILIGAAILKPDRHEHDRFIPVLLGAPQIETTVLAG
ncbi:MULTISPECIES: hypothetical protein [unclassified Ruegeria]|uniref:hypothetical protein n=1 Tax=unclassified Ruegeria TaxID=2625375 RepID=UPI001AEB297D|nr:MULTISPECIES: hypothetical protein [unclassified Ruegeria]